MWSARVVLSNASAASSWFKRRAESRYDVKFCLPERDVLGSISEQAKDVPSLSGSWAPEAFWVPTQQADGFPVFCLSSSHACSEFVKLLADKGVRATVATDHASLHHSLFLCVTVTTVILPGMKRFNRDVVPEELVNWVVEPWGLGCAHSDAYSKFVNHPLGRTEDVWGKLGAYPWEELENMLAKIVVSRIPVDDGVWRNLCGLLDAGDNYGALAEFDKLVTRGTKHKRRHYFDVCTLYTIASKVWSDSGQGPLFRRVAKLVLFDGITAQVGYERLYLTCFWLFTTPYWQSICKFFLAEHLFFTTVDEYRDICKEITARVSSCWMFPRTNLQHIASAYFLNAEDLTGFADNQESSGQVAVEVLEFALSEFEYTLPGDEGRSFDMYLKAYRDAVRSLLEPLYREFGVKAQTYDEILETRTAWAAGGVAGRRARDVLGAERAPPGSSKAYVMSMSRADDFRMDWGDTRNEIANKMDERGPPRCIQATDMRDQTAETYVFKHFSNKYPRVGLDIGESPTEAMARHAQLVGATRGSRVYKFDGRLLTAWDWQKWDHFYHNSEKVIVLQVMRELTGHFVRPAVKAEMLRELDDLIDKHSRMVYRSQAFADEYYGKLADEVIASSNGRAYRLDGREGEVSIMIEKPNGQQSGRKTTLEANTIVGTSRLLVRDAELLGTRASVKNRVALYSLNRADDVAEVHACYKRGVDAVNTMLAQGHRANPKKQVAQWRSVVYLRILYAGGSMRAFPPRAVYAAASGHPDKGAGSESAFIDKLKSCSKGLDMWVRRGGFMRMAQALYADVERFFSKTRVWAIKGDKRTFTTKVIPVAALRAAPENNGLGILPPGVYEYDYTVKCVTPDKYKAIADGWQRRIDEKVRAGIGPGIHDLERRARDWVFDNTKLVPTDKDMKRYKEKWAASRVHQDGTGDSKFLNRCKQVALAVKIVRVDKSDRSYIAKDTNRVVDRGLAALRGAIEQTQYMPGTHYAKDYLKSIRGFPGYGMTEHLWYGYGSILLASAKERGRGEWERVLVLLANSSALGREFLALSTSWTLEARSAFLCGELGPVGGWDKLIPPSWIGWLNDIVGLGLALELTIKPALSRCAWRMFKFRASLTKEAAVAFVNSYPELCIH
ncbi:RNA-dependent RNA polymerase [Fusarium poae alternavirus 1]|uniref:RNA-dependent RNA polymerase n=1 Tax=Fusarium poae alternavirus 1 TaxID=1849539 RepID=UPI00084814A0|nr:RNA-dependent RNA polymerase [Fusarium poae alternavirus 1]BAV56306.1 RNA-dependent RNA polymerase [Fusarium poae alternavirus 1]